MPGPLVEIKDVDRRFYEERLRSFLPHRIIDIRAHLRRAAEANGPSRGDIQDVFHDNARTLIDSARAG